MGLGDINTRVKVVGGVVIVVIVFIVVMVIVSLEKLNSDQVALMYNTVNMQLSTTPEYEGLHSGPPGFRFITFSSVFKTLNFHALNCLNQDGVEITLDISYQYRVRGGDLYEVISQFREQDTFEKVLTLIGESSVHDACAQYNTSQFQAERGAFQEDIRKRLVAKYSQVSCDVTDLQVNDIQRPQKYENSVKNKESAREDIEVARNERPQKLTEVETKRRESETSANITVDKANSEARITLQHAKLEAEAILNQYQKEAESYKVLLSSSGLNLNNEGFLAYMGVRVIEDAKQNVAVGMGAPAKTAYFTP